MPNFVIDFTPAAEAGLAAAWMLAASQVDVTRAQDAAERELASNPIGAGKHLSEGLYRLVTPPLVLTYSVDVPGRTVSVVGVGIVRQPPPGFL